MELAKLGYTQKWIDYKFLTQKAFKEQLAEFELAEYESGELLRFDTFMVWIEKKKKFTQVQIDQLLELAKEDEDEIMAGSVIRELFSSPFLTAGQFGYLCTILPSFGDWTTKMIKREVLNRRIENEPITSDVYHEALDYKQEFDDNRPLINIIRKTDNQEILADFEENGCGKRVRTMAQKRLNQLKRLG